MGTEYNIKESSYKGRTEKMAEKIVFCKKNTHLLPTSQVIKPSKTYIYTSLLLISLLEQMEYGKSNFNAINSVAYYGQELLSNYYYTIYELD